MTNQYAGNVSRTTRQGLCGTRVHWENLGARVVLVGEAPGPDTDPSAPLFWTPENATGGRLVRLLGVNPTDYGRMFGRVNLLNEWHASRWPRGEAEHRAVLIRDAVVAARPIGVASHLVPLGSRVRQAFGFEPGDAPFLTTRGDDQRGITYWIAPHPSGRNYWFNDERNRREATAFFRMVAGVAHGAAA